MSKQALKRVRKEIGLPVCREPLPSFAWPGGYPLYYVFTDGGCICPGCVNENIAEIDSANRTGRPFNSHGGWAVIAMDVNYEDAELRCDHCSELIPAAYAE